MVVSEPQGMPQQPDKSMSNKSVGKAQECNDGSRRTSQECKDRRGKPCKKRSGNKSSILPRQTKTTSYRGNKSTILLWQRPSAKPRSGYNDGIKSTILPWQRAGVQAQECEHRIATAARPFVYIAWRSQQHDNKPRRGASAYKRTPLTPAAYPAGPIHYPPVMITGVAPGYPYPEVQECIRHTTSPHG
jgi:hypothetical protein